ncbi:hypothetical protein AHF37_03660 [Paragonimus kellicotti]|nr:hypothetical protein AHF37_03660 [Paragonimus kellicotti]
MVYKTNDSHKAACTVAHILRMSRNSSTLDFSTQYSRAEYATRLKLCRHSRTRRLARLHRICACGGLLSMTYAKVRYPRARQYPHSKHSVLQGRVCDPAQALSSLAHTPASTSAQDLCVWWPVKHDICQGALSMSPSIPTLKGGWAQGPLVEHVMHVVRLSRRVRP